MLRAILFDFNGVLVDDEDLHLGALRQALAEEGLDLTAPAYYRRYLGLDDRGCLAAVLTDRGWPTPPERLARLAARKAAYYRDRIDAHGFPVVAAAVALVRQAAAAGLMLGVVSGALRDEVEGALAQAGVRDCFKVLLTAEDLDRGKPAPEGYLHALELLNAAPPLPDRLLHPHEVLAVEDSPAGVRAAKAAGLAVLGVAAPAVGVELSEADRVVVGLAGLGLDALQILFAEISEA